MSPPHHDLPRARRLSERLFAVTDRVRRDFADIAQGFDLTAVQARAVLWLDTPSTMSDLAGHLACDPSNVTGLADRLQRRGLVERVTGADRRVKTLQLTPTGRGLRNRLAQRVAAGSTVTARLDRAEQDRLSDLLDKLLAEN